MRHVDESALRMNSGHGVARRLAGRDPVAQEQPDDLALARANLFTDDDPCGRQRGHLAGSVDGVVICDRDHIHAIAIHAAQDVIRSRQRIRGMVRVHVQVDSHRLTSARVYPHEFLLSTMTHRALATPQAVGP